MRFAKQAVTLSVVALMALVGGAISGRLLSGAQAAAGIDSKAATGADAPAPKIAVVAALKITDDLMNSDRYKPARSDYEEQLTKELIKPLTDKLEDLQKKIKDMDEKDPQANQMKQDFFRLRNELVGKQREASEKLEKKVSEQLKECYQLVRASAQAVAEKKGFNYVIASLRSDDKFEEGPMQVTMRELASRPLLVFPEGTDVTDDVREDLKL